MCVTWKSTSAFRGEAKLAVGSSFTIAVQRTDEVQTTSKDIIEINTFDENAKDVKVEFTVKSTTKRTGPTGAERGSSLCDNLSELRERNRTTYEFWSII